MKNVTYKLPLIDTKAAAMKNNPQMVSWKDIKDEVYGIKGTEWRDKLEREATTFRIGLLVRKAREEKMLTQEELGKIVDKKRSFISRIENDGSTMTLKTLFELVEKGLGGKVNISIDLEN